MRMPNIKIWQASLLAALLATSALIAPLANAATATSTLNVSLTITDSCIVSTTPVAFGTQGVLASAVDATGTVVVTCTNGTANTVSLDAGGGSGATTTARKLTGPAAAVVGYALYRDAGRTQLWGNTIGTDTAAGTGTGSAQTLTVYGRVPAQSTPAAGAYADVVNVTVTY